MAKMKPLETKEEMEHVVREACLASARIDEVMARMNEAIARAKEPFEAELAGLQQGYAALEEMALAWAKANPKEFATRRSVSFVHGVIGFRTGKPVLRLLKGVTWEQALDALRETMPVYVRRVEEVDKASILAAREDLGKERLRQVGLRVTQAERAYLEVDKQTLDEGGKRR